jgi:transposase
MSVVGAARRPRPHLADIVDRANFRTFRSVGAWRGLTAHRYQLSNVDYDGHASWRGDVHVQSLLYEAVTVILTRAHGERPPRRWGLQLRERIGFKRAAVAVVCNLAVVMHVMLKSGEVFTPVVRATA